MKDADKKHSLLMIFALVIYATVQSFAVRAGWFPADDAQELAFVRSIGYDIDLFGVDAFGLFRPVKNLLFLAFSALEPFGMSAVRGFAIALGVATFFPVSAFFNRVFADRRVALLGAATWLLSPTLVSSVAWLSCVNIQLMCGFAAGAFVCHDRGQPLSATLLLVLACVSYECAVAVGPCLVAFDFFLRSERFHRRRTWFVYASYAVATLAFLVIRHQIGATHAVNGSFAGANRLDVIAASACFTCQHLLAWLWPFGHMAVFGGYVKGSVPVTTLVLCWGMVSALFAGSFLLRGRRPALAFGLALALVGFLPVSNITGVGNGPYGDYYLGLASMGIAVVFVEVIRALWGLRMRLPLAVTALLATSRVVAIPEAARWVGLWADADRAYEETERTFPHSFHTTTCRAQRACDAGDWETALACCDRVASIVGTDSEKNAPALMVRALVALKGTKDPAAALAALDRALALPGIAVPHARQCRFYRGCVYEDLLNDRARAESEYVAAMPRSWTVDTVQVADRLARLLALRGERARATDLWTKALRLCPDNAAVRHNLSVVRGE